MANLSIRFFSDCLKRRVTFQMVLPNDVPVQRMDGAEIPGNPYQSRPMKTLFLLHGYTGDADNWVPEELAVKYNFAIVIPNGENGFWLDGISTGHAFCTFLGEELIGYVRKTFGLAMTKEDTYIMGLSMGGFGALHTSLAYPDVFGKAACLSSALIVHEVAGMTPDNSNPVANYEYYRECFGDPKTVLESESNPEVLVKKLKAEGKAFPELFMCCGTEDFLIENNRQMHRFLEEEQVPHTYCESKGVHDMVFWREYVEKFIPLMFG